MDPNPILKKIVDTDAAGTRNLEIICSVCGCQVPKNWGMAVEVSGSHPRWFPITEGRT